MSTTINPFQNVSNNTSYAGNGLGAAPAYIITHNGSGGGGGNGTISASTTWSNAAAAFQPGGVLELNGPSADILFNGASLKETLELIQSRLNILRPNTALEAEWDELKELGDLYRKKEAEFKEKQRAWEILKKV